MSFELPAGEGSAEPGLDKLFRALTAGPAAGELDGEPAALAMFRANFSPWAASSSSSADTAVITAGEPTEAAVPVAEVPLRRAFRWPGRWALAAAAAVALFSGTIAAAYAAVLPAPVQHLAHQVFGAVGVPDSPSRPAASGPAGSGHQGAPAGPGGKAHGTASPSLSPSAAVTAPGAAASPAPAAAPGHLLAWPSASEIAAGSPVTIDGQLLHSGRGEPGVTVTLLEWLAGDGGWRIAGTAQTDANGNVAVVVSALTQNAVFRLTMAGGGRSAGVLVRVSPLVSAALAPGSPGRADVLTISTKYADAGNVVVLEAQAAGGDWTYLRKSRLNAAGTAIFLLDGKRLAADQVRAVLPGTLRHAASISNQLAVPPPA